MDENLFIGCDWGTTSFRLTLADRPAGTPVSSWRDNDGIRNLHLSRPDGEVDSERFIRMRSILMEKRNRLAKSINRSLDGLPIVLSGMASSNIGLQELPYATLPLDLAAPGLVTRVFEADRAFPHRLVLVSGVRDREDVMRGEEIQLLGLQAKWQWSDAVCILPGTHSKHLFIQNGELVSFRSYMTGELFEVIASRTLLRNTVEPAEGWVEGGKDAFAEGVLEGERENLLNSLFAIRARHLLQRTDSKLAWYRLSGLLIGSELKALRDSSLDLFLAADEPLAGLYALALTTLGLPFRQETEMEHLTLLGQAAALDLADSPKLS